MADSFFSLAINGIQSVATENGYHVLICLTHESFESEKNILKEFQGGRVEGVVMSVAKDTSQSSHIKNLISQGIPLVFFDRVFEDVETAKITTNDFESSYKATEHLIKRGSDKISFLTISKSLSISCKRLDGYLKAHEDYKLNTTEENIILCSGDAKQNYLIIKKLLQRKDRPNGVIASVEKLTTPVYKACATLKLRIPQDVKVVCFSNLETASILNPSLTTITQPAFEMGKSAATALFNTLEKTHFNPINESLIIPSALTIRGSTS